ncbi:MAG TPA: glycosyltransferase family 39 protein, partial [Solirubrobacteraceae bacterium]|nr:glycosyltransferase family 39 protein [Solirubrobacteraceae bacterium]
LTVLAAALRFALIGHQGYWFDEGNTVLLVHLSPGKMLGLIPQSESTPPLYYGVAWAWARIFGFGEVGLRSLSAVAGVATVPVLWCAARRLASDRAAVIVAALTACNPLLVWYSQEARSYSLLVLMSALTLWTFALMLDEPSARRVVGWVVAGALALVTHYYAVLAVAPEAVWLLYVHRRRRPVQVGVGALVVCGLALLPYALNQNASGHASWISAAPLGRRVGELVPQFALGFQSPARGVLEPVAIVLLVLALVLLGWRAAPMERRAGLLAGGLALAGLVLNLLLIAGGVDDLITRNVLAIWPAGAVAVAVGLAASRARAAGVAAALALCALGVTTVIGVDADTARQKPDWRVVARALGPAPAVGQGRVVLIQHYRDLLPLSLSLPTLKFVPRGGATVSQLDVVSFTSPPSAGFCWWGSACNLWPSRIQRAYAIPGFRVVSRTRVRQFTVVRMVARRPVHVTASLVAPALTATRLHEDDLLLQRP